MPDDETENDSSSLLDDNIDDGTNKENMNNQPSTSRQNEPKRTFISPKTLPGKRKSMLDSKADEAYKILKETMANRTIRDESTIFGEHVANKHRKYNENTKHIVEHLISNVLFDADMGKYNEPFSHSQRPYSTIQSLTPLQSPSPTTSSTHSTSSPPTYHFLQSPQPTTSVSLTDFINNFRD